MKLMTIVAALGLLACKADSMLAGNNQTLSIDCAKQKTVSVTGNDNKVTLTGTCTRVTLTGNGNTVTGSTGALTLTGNDNQVQADSLDSVHIMGKTNTVSWKRAVTGASPSVSDMGKNNTVTQANAEPPTQ